MNAKTLKFLICSLIFQAYFHSACFAESCSCPETSSVVNALENSSVVFIGKVESINKSGRRKNFQEIRFKVVPNRRFKGFDDLPNNEYLLLYTPIEKSSCSFPFAEGFEYLVYANGNPAFLKVDSCSRTMFLDKAMEDQEKLLRLTESKK